MEFLNVIADIQNNLRRVGEDFRLLSRRGALIKPHYSGPLEFLQLFSDSDDYIDRRLPLLVHSSKALRLV